MTRGFSINLIAPVLALVTLGLAFLPSHSHRKIARIIAGVGVFFATIGIALVAVVGMKSPGGIHNFGLGFWAAAVSAVLLLSFAVFSGFCVDAKQKEDMGKEEGKETDDTEHDDAGDRAVREDQERLVGKFLAERHAQVTKMDAQRQEALNLQRQKEEEAAKNRGCC